MKENEKRDAETIYSRSTRWQVMDKMGNSFLQTIESRNYETYYSEIIDTIKEQNKRPETHDVNGRKQVKFAKMLNLEELRSFKIIKDDFKQNYFIPTNIPLEFFSNNLTKRFPDLLTDDKLSFSGKNIWQKYIEIKAKGKLGYFEMYFLQPLLSKFIVSKRINKFDSQEELKLLIEFETVYGFNEGFKETIGIF